MYSLLSTLLVLFFGLHVHSLSYPTNATSGMIGYAKMGGVTGGWNGSVVEINTLANLQQYIGGSTARVLVINSNIRASNMTTVNLGSNKSIIGSFNKPTLYNIYLRDTTRSGNIIIQNLIFQHDASIKANDDIQIHVSHSKKYWIDHCSFIGHTWSETDGSTDKLLYVGGIADYVTISNCYFGNHLYGLILGQPTDASLSTTTYNTRLTICGNYYNNFYVRGPGLFRYGHYHVFNNYVSNFHLGFTIATAGKIISENNYFENADAILDEKGTGQFTDTGSTPSITTQTSPKSDWFASSQYNYTLKTAKQAKSFAATYAGAQTSQLNFLTYVSF